MSIDITIPDLDAAAKTFCQAQQNLDQAWTKLWQTLDSLAGMAGDDEPAKKFTAKYNPAVDSAWKALFGCPGMA